MPRKNIATTPKTTDEPKPITIWDHLKNITTIKGDYLGDEGWNNKMVNRFLSMDRDYCEVVNIVQKNTWLLKGKYLYDLYKDIIPKKYVFLKYIKATNKKEYQIEDIEIIKEYYNVSGKEAKEYIDILSESELENIYSLMGKSRK